MSSLLHKKILRPSLYYSHKKKSTYSNRQVYNFKIQWHRQFIHINDSSQKSQQTILPLQFYIESSWITKTLGPQIVNAQQ